MSVNKTYSDSIYGNINLDIFCDIIIEHPHFQRLKDIKQLGLTYKVFKNVTHSRFEHSIGVAYLCKLAISKLKKDNDFISDKLVILVTLAGLLHDIGHGPQSHLFDKILEKKIIMMDEKMYEHEERSIIIFDAIRNNNEFLKKYLNEDEVKFIKDMILGNVEDKSNPRDCLIELLNNKNSIFDLDKLDYLNRDTYYYNGIKNKINYNKFIDNMKIVSVNNSYELCYSYELRNDFDNLFSLRFENHFNIYQNVNVKKWEKSFEDKFNESNVIEKFFNDGFDIDEFCNLTDSFFKLNKCDYIILGESFQNFQMNKISNELKNTKLLCDEYIINHGCREENPVSKIIFYLDDSVFKLMNNNNRKRYQEIYKYLYYKDNKENNKNLNKFNRIYNKLSFLR